MELRMPGVVFLVRDVQDIAENSREATPLPPVTAGNARRSGARALKYRTWLRHVATLPAVMAGAWYGVEAGSRGALLLAGAAAVAWFVWPETARFVAWRRARRAERARRRDTRAVERASRRVAKAERARQRADRYPGSERLARRAERLEKRAKRALVAAERAATRAAELDGDR